MKHPPFQKYAGVIAAAAVFASWIVSNTYLDTAKGLRANMESIVAFQRDHDQRRLMWNWFRNNERQLDSLERKIDTLAFKPASSEEMRYNSAWGKLPLLGVISQEITDLVIFTGELEKTADGVAEEPKLRVAAKALKETVWALNETLEKLGNEFHAGVERIAAARRQSFIDLSPDQRERTISAIDDYERQVFQLADGGTKLQNDVWRLANEIVLSAKQRASLAAAQATSAQTLSYFFFVGGTLLALWGKYFEANAGTKGTQDDPELETTA